jgi:hypothetical protein
MVAAIRMSIDRFNDPVMIKGSTEEDSSQSGKRSRAGNAANVRPKG